MFSIMEEAEERPMMNGEVLLMELKERFNHYSKWCDRMEILQYGQHPIFKPGELVRPRHGVLHGTGIGTGFAIVLHTMHFLSVRPVEDGHNIGHPNHWRFMDMRILYWSRTGDLWIKCWVESEDWEKFSG